MNDDLAVTGNSDLQGNADVGGNATVDGSTTLGDGDAADALTINTGAGTDLSVSEDGVDRSSGVDETFTFENSGAGDLNVNINGDLSSTGDATIASDAGSNATVGNTTGTSTVEGSDINIGPAGPGTIDIGNAGSTTTLDGTVVFTNPPSLPLADNAIFVGDGTNVAAPYASTNDPGAVLQQDGAGQPLWSRDLDVENITAGGNLDVDGATMLDDLTVDGPSVLNGATSVNDDLTVTGNSDLQGNADVGGDLTVVGNSDLQGNADVGGNATVDGSTTLGDGDAGDAVTINTGGGTDLAVSEDGVDRSSGVDETFTFENSGAGDLNVNINGDLSSTGDATIASDAGSNATVGNTTGTSTVEGSDINIGPAGPGTIDIGNAGSTTTLDGTVVFTNPPSITVGRQCNLCRRRDQRCSTVCLNKRSGRGLTARWRRSAAVESGLGCG